MKPHAAKDAIKRIHIAIRAIPVGSVAGYGVVARRAGLPGRARLVARVLSNNDDPTLPWHRVLRSDGRIAFPSDSEGYAEQTQRLRAEGVAVENGRVRDLRQSGSDLDALLWAPPRKRSAGARQRQRVDRHGPLSHRERGWRVRGRFWRRLWHVRPSSALRAPPPSRGRSCSRWEGN